MSADAFRDAAELGRTRAAMNKPLGEIIASVIGDDRIKELFDAEGKHPDLYKDEPTGLIALKLGVITPETKTALLVAQAAERTYQLAEKAGSMALNHDDLVKDQRAQPGKDIIDRKAAGFFPLDDPVFKFVGSDKDPDILKSAQATWVASQMYLNNQLESVICHKEDVSWENPPMTPAGPDYAAGLKSEAARYYGVASDMLAQQGHSAAADRFAKIAQSMVPASPQNAPGPAQLVRTIATLEEKAVATANDDLGMWSGSSSVLYAPGLDPQNCNRLISLIDLGSPAGRQPQPKPPTHGSQTP